MRNVADNVVQNIQTHVLRSLVFLDNWAAREVMWENIVEFGRPQMTVRRMRIACWIHKATNKHSDSECNNGCMNAPQYYFIRTVPVFFFANFGRKTCKVETL
jgi:hypothetical protein